MFYLYFMFATFAIGLIISIYLFITNDNIDVSGIALIFTIVCGVMWPMAFIFGIAVGLNWIHTKIHNLPFTMFNDDDKEI